LPINMQEILSLYDEDVRREAVSPGTRREVADPLVRQVMEAESEGHSYIAYSSLDARNADAIIAREVAYFAALGRPVEWAVHAHDRPPDLGRRLAAHGFVAQETEAILVLDLENLSPRLARPPAADVRRLTERSDLEVARRLLEAVWQEPFGWFVPRMQRFLATGHVAIYLAFVAGEPASAAWIFLPEDSRFASLYGGTTLPAYRGQGLYTALLATRAQEALSRGYRYLTIDAGDMSRPIVEKHGFQLLTTATPYLKRF
jgi:GNAT superfamily N-acetyltransferase